MLRVLPRFTVNIISITRNFEIIMRGDSKYMPIKCELVERVSKDGVKYVCLEIYITPTYKKLVFLKTAEIELLKLSYKDKN